MYKDGHCCYDSGCDRKVAKFMRQVSGSDRVEFYDFTRASLVNFTFLIFEFGNYPRKPVELFNALSVLRAQYKETGFCDNSIIERLFSHCRSLGLRHYPLYS